MMEGRFSDRYPPSEVMSDAAVSERNDSPISIPSASLGTTSPADVGEALGDAGQR